jgi:hypothetical protein
MFQLRLKPTDLRLPAVFRSRRSVKNYMQASYRRYLVACELAYGQAHANVWRVCNPFEDWWRQRYEIIAVEGR